MMQVSARWDLAALTVGVMALIPVDIAIGQGGFLFDNVTPLSQVALEDFPGQPTRGNDCWGYVSPSGREYALMGLKNEVAVVEITSPSLPVIIGEISHAESNWCDIKVYQNFAYAVNEELGGMAPCRRWHPRLFRSLVPSASATAAMLRHPTSP